MATITVEDGTIVANATSYVSVADVESYISERALTTITSADIDELIIRSMDYIEGLNFKGVKLTKDQSLIWPRAGVVKDSYLVDTDEIPQELKDAVSETVIAINDSKSPLADLERSKQSVGVGGGAVSVTYAVGGNQNTIVRTLNNKLSKLLRDGASGTSFTVSRG